MMTFCAIHTCYTLSHSTCQVYRYRYLLAWWWSRLVDICLQAMLLIMEPPWYLYIFLFQRWTVHGGIRKFINTQELQRLDAAVPVEPFNMEERVKTIHERSCTRPALVKTTLDICTVHCCMIHLEALEDCTSQGLSICWRSCLRNSVTISKLLWSHMVQTSTLSSASTATLTGVEYLRQLYVSGTEGDWLTPLMPPSAPVRHCSLKSVGFHVAVWLQILMLCTSLMFYIIGSAAAIWIMK